MWWRGVGACAQPSKHPRGGCSAYATSNQRGWAFAAGTLSAQFYFPVSATSLSHPGNRGRRALEGRHTGTPALVPHALTPPPTPMPGLYPAHLQPFSLTLCAPDLSALLPPACSPTSEPAHQGLSTVTPPVSRPSPSHFNRGPQSVQLMAVSQVWKFFWVLSQAYRCFGGRID